MRKIGKTTGLITMLFGIVLLGFVTFGGNTNTADATFVIPTPTPSHHACNVDHMCVLVPGSGNSTCETNSNCVTPTPKPTATPTPTPKVDCDKDHHDWNNWDKDKCPTPTVTPTPTASPSPTITPTPGNNNSGGNGGGGEQSNQAPGPAICNIPFQAPVLQGFQADGNGSVTFSWWPSPNVSKYSITYGYTPDNLMFGEDNIPSSSTSIQLNGLIPGHNVWAQVQGWQGGCEESSNLFDPIVL